MKPKSSQRPRILIIDDDVELRDTLDQIISDTYETVATGDAREALKMLTAGEKFDVIMCDLMMPNMSGVEFYQMLKLQAPLFCTKVLFLTGGSFTLKTTDFLKQPGIQACEKPIQIENLLEHLQSIVDRTDSATAIKAS